MSLSMVLPEKWVEIAKYRDVKYKNDSLKHLRTKKSQFEACVKCSAFRVRTVEMYGGEFVITRCVFVNKCIKQYPHRLDRGEFK